MERRTPIHLLIVVSFIAITYLILYYEVSIAKSLGISLNSFGVLLSIIEISVSLTIYKIFFKRSINYFTNKSWKHNTVTVLLFSIMFSASIPVNFFHEKIFNKKFSTNNTLEEISLESNPKGPQSTIEKHTKIAKDISFITINSLSEEITYRLLVIVLLTTILSRLNAVILSSLLFGISHLWAQLGHHPSLFVSSFVVINSTVVGMVLGFVYLRSGLVASFMFHLLANLVVQYIRPNPIYWKTFCIALIVMTLILGVILITKTPKALKSLADKIHNKKAGTIPG